MQILLSNDDGVSAKGLRVLREELLPLADLVVFAPDRNRSGASNSLTLERPVRVKEIAPNINSVEGTPTDCVHLALTGLLTELPDMVISGINEGANLGDDVWYSGTVAAAIEGRFLGFPAMAISLAGEDTLHYETAALVAKTLVLQLRRHPLPKDVILNVNVPDVPWSDLRGFAATRLGARHPAEPAIVKKDPRGRTIYWIGFSGGERDAGPGTDFYAIRHQQVSITPLQLDVTRYDILEPLGFWLSDMPLDQATS